MNAAERTLTGETLHLVESIAENAVADLFHAYGVPLARGAADKDLTRSIHLSGIVGFSGPGLRGSCILAASAEPIHNTIPVDGSDRDWIAELANQLIGRIKNRLLSHGAEVYVTTPVVLRGKHLAPVPRVELPPLTFHANPGNVFVWIELETMPGFSLGPPMDTVPEGTAMLF